MIGWRIYALHNGRLAPPWVGRIWSHLVDDSERVTDAARCLVHRHAAPAPGCTCGHRATEDLAELLRYGLTPRECWPAGMLVECGVLAQVWLQPPHQPGCGVPYDDPPTTRRGAGIQMLGLYVAPPATAHAAALRVTYGCEVFERPSWEPPADAGGIITSPDARPDARR